LKTDKNPSLDAMTRGVGSRLSDVVMRRGDFQIAPRHPDP
jgi:hypothetical protein